MKWLLLALAIIAEVIATTALKPSQGFTRLWPSVITAVGYLAAFYLMSLTLKSIPVAIVYAVWSGAGIVLLSLISWLWFKQALDAPAVIGIGLIIAGISIMNLFSGAVRH